MFLVGFTGNPTDNSNTAESVAARPVHTFTVQAYANEREETYLGRVRAPIEIDLAFEVGGRLHSLDLPTGTRATAGTPLAHLDATQYELTLAAAEERLAYAEKELDRTRRLQATGSAAVAELDRAINARTLARIARDQAREDLANTVLRAPYDGRVATRRVERGSYVDPGKAVLVFQADEATELDFYLTESQLERLLKGLENGRAAATVADGLAAGISLTLRDYATAPDPRTGAYRVTMRLEDVGAVDLLPGTPVRVTVLEELPDRQGVVRIPADAIVGDAATRQQVWVLPEHQEHPTAREIVVGRAGPDFVEVLQGLRRGDRVITSGATLLRPQMRVKALQES